jgi:hypothetical protein
MWLKVTNILNLTHKIHRGRIDAMKEIYVTPEIFEEELEEKDIVTSSTLEKGDNDIEIDW